MSFYHDGQRDMQAMFGSRPLADRLEQNTHRIAFTDADRAFIEGVSFFFLATADAEGQPDCSYKGGAPGFVRVPEPNLLVFPDYDGNGMFRSLGNLAVNPRLGMVFIQLSDSPKRLRVNGRATVTFADPMLDEFPGAQALVRVVPEHVFPNCPRYIHDLGNGRVSPYVPDPEKPPLEPAWKSFEVFRDVVPPRRRT